MTTPNDSYLWDQSGAVDTEVAALEQLLGRFAHRPAPQAEHRPEPAGPELAGQPRRPRIFLSAAAAAVILAGLAWWLLGTAGAPTIEQPPIAAAPAKVDDRPLDLGTPLELAAGEHRVDLGPGVKLFVEGPAALRLERFDLEGTTTLGLERGAARLAVQRRDQARIELALPWGRIVAQDASLEAWTDRGPRGQVVVGTGGLATITANGSGARTLLLPLAAEVFRVGAERLSTPVAADSSAKLRKLLAGYDQIGPAGDIDIRRRRAGDLAAAATEPRDTLPLWHLLQDPDAEIQRLAEAALLRLAGLPAAARAQKAPGDLPPEMWRDHLEPRWR